MFRKLSIDDIINSKDIYSLASKRIEIILKSNIMDAIDKERKNIRAFKEYAMVKDEDITKNDEYIKELKNSYRNGCFRDKLRQIFD